MQSLVQLLHEHQTLAEVPQRNVRFCERATDEQRRMKLLHKVFKPFGGPVELQSLVDEHRALTGSNLQTSTQRSPKVQAAGSQIQLAAKDPEEEELDAGTNVVDPAADANKKSFTIQYWAQLNDMFGMGDQLFTMVQPGTALDAKRYSYNEINAYSQAVRPLIVQEAEFALTDQMVGPFPISAGANGQRLSVVYQNVINNYIPLLKGIAPFFEDRAGLAGFLLASSGEEDELGRPKSRIQVCQELTSKWLNATLTWKKDQTAELAKCDKVKGTECLENYARWLTTVGETRQNELHSLYNDCVVRGFYHEVLTIVGYLNASTFSGRLEKTKQAMRSSGRTSIDQSYIVYPVTMNPSNWFKMLTPNIRPQDMLNSQDAIRDQINQKQRTLRLKESQLISMNAVSNPAMVKKLQTQVDSAQKAYDEAQAALTDKYGSGLTTAVSAGLQLASTFGGGPGAAKAFAEGAVGGDPTSSITDAVGAITDAISGTNKADAELREKGRQMAELQAKEGLVSIQSHQGLKDTLTREVAQLKADIADLQAQLYQIMQVKAKDPQRTPAPKEGEEFLPPSKEAMEYASLWTEVIITSSNSKSSKSDSASSSSSSKKTSGGFLFFSGGSSSSSSSSQSSAQAKSWSAEIKLGLRCAKVQFDRGGWFDPSILAASGNFSRLNKSYGGCGLDKDKVVNQMSTKQINDECLGKLLPSYTTAMLLAKDITIKFTYADDSTASSQAASQSSSSSGGGCLFFSTSKSSASASSSSSSFSSHDGKSVNIKIPGPQIIGYFQVLTLKDESPEYTSGGSKEMVAALKHYETNLVKEKAAQARQPEATGTGGTNDKLLSKIRDMSRDVPPASIATEGGSPIPSLLI